MNIEITFFTKNIENKLRITMKFNIFVLNKIVDNLIIFR